MPTPTSWIEATWLIVLGMGGLAGWVIRAWVQYIQQRDTEERRERHKDEDDIRAEARNRSERNFTMLEGFRLVLGEHRETLLCINESLRQGNNRSEELTEAVRNVVATSGTVASQQAMVLEAVGDIDARLANIADTLTRMHGKQVYYHKHSLEVIIQYFDALRLDIAQRKPQRPTDVGRFMVVPVPVPEDGDSSEGGNGNDDLQ